MSLRDSFLQAIESVIHKPSSAASVSLHEPQFEKTDQQLVAECLDSGFVSSVSPFVNKFESTLAALTGTNVVACSNGTAALHICCLLSGVKPGDEVLVPALTFVATANAIAYCGAIPHFVDIEIDSLGVDPKNLREYLNNVGTVTPNGFVNNKTKRIIRALVVVHLFGHAAKIEELLQVASEFKIELIEDAAESLGSSLNERSLGTFAKTAATSFNGNKIITTGGGGAVFCQDKETAALAKHLTTTAKKPHPYLFEHDMLGYNYRLPGINAALGCAQLQRLEKYLRQKRLLAEAYKKSFSEVSGVKFYTERAGSRSNYWLNLVLLDSDDLSVRNDILEFTNLKGIMTRPVWTLLNKLPMFKDSPSAPLPVSESIERRAINLPSSPFLASKENV